MTSQHFEDTSYQIRPAEPRDIPIILELIRELAAYEREPDAVVATEQSLLRDGFGPIPRFHVLLAELENKTIGFAFYVFTYSTWRGSPVLYLEDIFIKPEYRKRGIGLALMKKLAAVAVASGCERFTWQVLDWNEPAIRFYEKCLGAKILKEWIPMRVDGDTLKRLAE